ncbi:putative 60S ribosomal protein L19, partial [Trypanosoma conorhini]
MHRGGIGRGDVGGAAHEAWQAEAKYEVPVLSARVGRRGPASLSPSHSISLRVRPSVSSCFCFVTLLTAYGRRGDEAGLSAASMYALHVCRRLRVRGGNSEERIVPVVVPLNRTGDNFFHRLHVWFCASVRQWAPVSTFCTALSYVFTHLSAVPFFLLPPPLLNYRHPLLQPLQTMVSLKLQARLAADILRCGRHRVWLDPNEASEISNANSRKSVRKLIKDGLIIRKPVKVHSRSRWRHIKEAKSMGRHEGPGRRRRVPAKARHADARSCG